MVRRPDEIVSAGDELTRLTGYGVQQLCGRRLAEALVVEADRDELEAVLQRLPAGGTVRLETRLARRDGTALPAELTIVDGARLGGADRLLVIVRDLFGQRLTEQIAIAGQALTTAIARAGTPEEAMQTLLCSLAQRMNWTEGTYWALDGGGTLRAAAAWPDDQSPDAAPGALPQRARHSGTAEWADADRAGGGVSGIAIPVCRSGALLGVLELGSVGPRSADPAVAEALMIAGAQLGELLGVLEDRFSLVAGLTRLALTDELTELPNRRAWEDSLARELARARRSGLPVCVAVLDLDNFKAFNDQHGHQAGDHLLAETARSWQEQLRATDVLARYGGEEFAAVIPAWPLELAVDVVERLRRATPGGLTASAGVASWDGHEDGASLFGRADAALYEAKQRGRDRTIAVDGERMLDRTADVDRPARGARAGDAQAGGAPVDAA